MIGGPKSYGAGGYQKTPLEETLPGRHGRARPPEAARHRAGRRHRPVGLDGGLPLQHVRGRDGRRQRDRRRPEGRHRQGGDPAGRGGAHRSRRARGRRLQRGRALGRADPAARRHHATCRARSPGSAPTARRTSSPASTRPCSRSRAMTATRRHIILLTDGWSSSGPVRRDPRQDEGGRDHALDGRRRRRLEPVPREPRQAGRRPVLRGDQPVEHPRHLPQGDAAGLRPADRRGDVLPDPDLELADPARASTPACPSCAATTGPRSRRPRRTCSSPPATTRSSPSGSTASGAPWPGPRTRPGAGRRTGSAWSGFNRFFSQLVSWTFPGEETDGIEATFETTGGQTGLHVESVGADGSPRDFYATSAVLVGPDLEPRTVNLVQIAPGVYEAPLGEIEPGAYAVRVTQTRPGSSPLGRTVGMVAQTAAEYRAAGCQRAVPRVAARGDRRDGHRHAARPVAARPDRHRPVHRTVAAAAGPGAAALAARHRPAPDVARAARAGGGPRLGHWDRAPPGGGRATNGDRRGHARGAAAAPGRASARERRGPVACRRRRGGRSHGARPRPRLSGRPTPAVTAPTAAPSAPRPTRGAPPPRLRDAEPVPRRRPAGRRRPRLRRAEAPTRWHDSATPSAGPANARPRRAGGLRGGRW